MAYNIYSSNFKNLVKKMSTAMQEDVKKLMIADKFSIEYGVPEKKAQKSKGKKQVFISDYARRLNYGSMEGGVPARPFLSTVQGRYQNRITADIKKALRENKEEMLGENVDSDAIVKKNLEKNVAFKLVNYTRDNILNGNWKSNSPATILIKGSSKPLIDTGEMIGSIVSVVSKRK